MISTNFDKALDLELERLDVEATAYGGAGGGWMRFVQSGAAQARFWLNVAGGLMVAIFVLMMVLLLVFRGAGAFPVAAITTVSGVTLAGAVKQLSSIARTLFEFEMFEDLIRDLPDAERAALAKSLMQSRKSKEK